MTQLMEKGALGKLIINIGKSGTKLDAQIQLAAVACIGYSIVDRNISPAKDLLAAISKGHRADSLVAYFERFGNIAYSSADKDLKFHQLTVKGAKVEWDEKYVQEVQGLMWTQARRPAAIVSKYDFQVVITGVVDRFKKIAKDTTKTVENKALLDEIGAVLNRYNFEQFSKGTTIAVEHDEDLVNKRNAKKRKQVADAKLAALKEHMEGQALPQPKVVNG